jgi:hypothetical protein
VVVVGEVRGWWDELLVWWDELLVWWDELLVWWPELVKFGELLALVGRAVSTAWQRFVAPTIFHPSTLDHKGALIVTPR